MKVTLHGDEEQTMDINIPLSPYHKSYFALSPHKCGSVLLQNIVSDLAKESEYPFLNIFSEIFAHGMPYEGFTQPIELILRLPGYCFAGLRFPWTTNVSYLGAHQKVFLVRDPRDVLVSYYFSMIKSHPLPGDGPLQCRFLKSRQECQSQSIGQFIDSGIGFFILGNMRTFLKWSSDLPQSHVFRYEDVIFQKEAWITQISEIFDMNIPTKTIKEIAERHNIIPSNENPDQHIRQVRPGNYKVHMSREHVAMVEAQFPDLFEAFSYRQPSLNRGSRQGLRIWQGQW